MGTDEPVRDRIRLAIQKLIAQDRAAGRLGDPARRARYARLFRGHEDLVEQEFARLEDVRDTLDAMTGAEQPLTPPESAPTQIERIGAYRVLRELGRGGMGVVYLAEDTRLGRQVALKVLPPALAAATEFRARFVREAAVASRLDHAGICTVYEAGEEDGALFMAMRYVEGASLADWIARSLAVHPSGCITGLPVPGSSGSDAVTSAVHAASDLDRALLLVERTARALHAAHEAGLIHRDVKPANVMVTVDGEPVVLDFGLARAEDDDDRLTRTGSILGTPVYMSPEQLQAAKYRLDRRTDVYSLGVLLYECVTLKLPFEAPTLQALHRLILESTPDDPRRINHQISADLRTVVETAIEKDRDRRYQTALALAEDLRRVREHEPILARPVGRLTKLARWAQRNPALAASVAVAFVAIATGLGVALHLLGKETDARELAQANFERSEIERTAKEAAHDRLRFSALLAEASAARLRGDWTLALHLALAASKIEQPLELVEEVHDILDGPQEVLLAPGLHLTKGAASDGSRFVAQGWGKGAADGVFVRDLHSGRSTQLDVGHYKFLDRATFSASAARVALPMFEPRDGGESTVRVYDISDSPETANPTHEFPVHDAGRLTAEISSPGDLVVVSAPDGRLWAWHLDDARVTELPAHPHAVRAAISADGSRIVAASRDGRTLRLFSVRGELLWDRTMPESIRGTPGISPVADRLLVSMDHEVHLLDQEGELVWSTRNGRGWTSSAEMSVDGQYILLNPMDLTTCVRDRDGNIVRIEPHEMPPLFGDFASDSKATLITSVGRVWIDDLSGRRLHTLPTGNSLRWTTTRDGRWVVPSRVGSRSPLTIWAIDRGESGIAQVSASPVWRTVWSKDASRLLVSHEDGTVALVDRSGRVLARVADAGECQEGFALACAFAADGRSFVTWEVLLGSYVTMPHSTISLRGEDGRETARVDVEKLLAVRMAPNGSYVATLTSGGALRLWGRSGVMLAEIDEEDHRVHQFDISPDATQIVTTSRKGVVQLWDTEGRATRPLAHTQKQADGQLGLHDRARVCFSSDGARVSWSPAGSSEFSRSAPRHSPVARSSSTRRLRVSARCGPLPTACFSHRATGSRHA